MAAGMPKLSQFTAMLKQPETQFEKTVENTVGISPPEGPNSMLLDVQKDVEAGKTPTAPTEMGLPTFPELGGLPAGLPTFPDIGGSPEGTEFGGDASLDEEAAKSSETEETAGSVGTELI